MLNQAELCSKKGRAAKHKIWVCSELITKVYWKSTDLLCSSFNKSERPGRRSRSH